MCLKNQALQRRALALANTFLRAHKLSAPDYYYSAHVHKTLTIHTAFMYCIYVISEQKLFKSFNHRKVTKTKATIAEAEASFLHLNIC